MDEDERTRLGYFRDRWAQENFRSQQHLSVTDNDRDHQQIAVADVPEYNSPSPIRNGQHTLKPQKRSWRDNFSRFSPSRLTSSRQAHQSRAESDMSTSFRSPVDSQNNTIYSDHGTSAEERPPPKMPSDDEKQVEKQPEPRAKQKFLNELYNLSWLAFFSLLGTLSRVGVEALTQYPDAPVTSRVLWANLGGSFVMGFLVEDRNLFGLPVHLKPELSKEGVPEDDKELTSIHLKHKKTIPLYVGMTTGFCGSFTSFSSFMTDSFLAMANALDSPSPRRPYRPYPTPPASRNGGFSFLALLAILILHPAVSLTALKVGSHFALLLRPYMPRQIFPTNFTSRVLNPLAVVLGFGCWLIGALFLTIFTPSSGPSPVDWRARATIPLLFAPPGCILRYYLAKWYNKPGYTFFWGTFIANVLGTFVDGMAFDLQHARSFGANVAGGNSCAVLLGVQQGFCGCLSTVSTWVVELNGSSKRAGWIYGISSVAISLAGVIVIMGSMAWTVGFASPVCG